MKIQLHWYGLLLAAIGSVMAMVNSARADDAADRQATLAALREQTALGPVVSFKPSQPAPIAKVSRMLGRLSVRLAEMPMGVADAHQAIQPVSYDAPLKSNATTPKPAAANEQATLAPDHQPAANADAPATLRFNPLRTAPLGDDARKKTSESNNPLRAN